MLMADAVYHPSYWNPQHSKTRVTQCLAFMAILLTAAAIKPLSELTLNGF